jgi:DNA replication protein DnaC
MIEPIARIGELPPGFLPGMPQRWRAAVTGREPLTAEDAERADLLEQQADAAAAEEMRARQHQFRTQAWDEALSRAARFRHARVALLKPQQDPGGLVTSWLDQPSLTLVLPGESRRGKTFAAYAVGHAAFERGWWVTAWRVSDLLRYLRPSDRDPGRAESTWDAVTRAGLVILDDLGSESRNTDWPATQMMDILDDRTRNNRRTVITTNLSEGELAAAYGDPFVYRLIEGTIAPVKGEVIDDTGRLVTGPAGEGGTGP